MPNAIPGTVAEGEEIADLEKIFWIVNVSKYPELRKIEGCGALTDLNATITDC